MCSPSHKVSDRALRKTNKHGYHSPKNCQALVVSVWHGNRLQTPAGKNMTADMCSMKWKYAKTFSNVSACESTSYASLCWNNKAMQAWKVHKPINSYKLGNMIAMKACSTMTKSMASATHLFMDSCHAYSRNFVLAKESMPWLSLCPCGKSMGINSHWQALNTAFLFHSTHMLQHLQHLRQIPTLAQKHRFLYCTEQRLKLPFLGKTLPA